MRAAERDLERDILPMCASEGTAVAPWGALGRGNVKTEEEFEKTKGEGRQMGEPSQEVKAITKVLDGLAGKKKAQITGVALAYVMHRYPYTCPIAGGGKVEHLKANVEALAIELTDEEVDEIDAATEFSVGFPMNFLFEYGGAQKYNSRMGW